MSNKLVKHQESKEILTGNQKKILFWICFIILSIAFITVWINILLTSKAFNTQMEEMVLGEDYYMEDIVITGKRAEDASADTISQNYFFYYNNGKVNDYHKRMQVPGFVYSEYNVGDSIAAYTTDHVSYSYYKYGILPDTEYTNNELMKVAGVLLGIGIFLLALFWYPFPMLLRSLTFSPILRNAIILALICFLAILFLSGKLFLKDYALIGWTAIGSLIFGIVLAVLFHKEYIGSLIFALCALAIYVMVSLINKFRNKL